jgi:hypothetical protein
MMDKFWEGIETALTRIKTEQPDTFEKLAAILNEAPDAGAGGPLTDTHTFFGGSGGDAQLWEALWVAGWRFKWDEGDYHWFAKHGRTRAHIEYIEGDVYDRTGVDE